MLIFTYLTPIHGTAAIRRFTTTTTVKQRPLQIRWQYIEEEKNESNTNCFSTVVNNYITFIVLVECTSTQRFGNRVENARVLVSDTRLRWKNRQGNGVDIIPFNTYNRHVVYEYR